MRPDQMRLSSVGLALLVISAAVGGGIAALAHNPVPAIAGAAVGLYFSCGKHQSVSVTLLRVRGRSGLRPFWYARDAAKSCAGTM